MNSQGITCDWETEKKKKKPKTNKTSSWKTKPITTTKKSQTCRDCVYLNILAKRCMNPGMLQTLCSNDVASDIRRNAFHTGKGNLVQNYLQNSAQQGQQLFYLPPAYFVWLAGSSIFLKCHDPDILEAPASPQARVFLFAAVSFHFVLEEQSMHFCQVIQ